MPIFSQHSLSDSMLPKQGRRKVPIPAVTAGLCCTLTFGDNPFQAHDVGVIELPHDGCLTQEVPPLRV